MTDSGRDDELLRQILQAIERIEAYVATYDRGAFLDAPMVQDAVIRNIAIVGEAARRLSPAMTQAQAHVSWRDMIGMRNRLIHGYVAVNMVTVWNTVIKDLPVLRHQVEEILARSGDGSR